MAGSVASAGFPPAADRSRPAARKRRPAAATARVMSTDAAAISASRSSNVARPSTMSFPPPAGSHRPVTRAWRRGHVPVRSVLQEYRMSAAYVAAALQLTSTSDETANWESARRLIERAAAHGARLVATPEN